MEIKNSFNVYYIGIYKENIKVEVKSFDSFWDTDLLKSGNAFRDREEAEEVANKIRGFFATCSTSKVLPGFVVNKEKDN